MKDTLFDLKATVKVDIYNIPEELLSNLISQFIDDINTYLTEVWGLTLDEFCAEVENISDDIILLS